ncbi:hypothetical protein C8J57DRAFT_1470876 [Mycena rebaudengoi]|nr:hypothetical protein C8J57DRAFT_1470876 [Mycena rebaudengoi]
MYLGGKAYLGGWYTSRVDDGDGDGRTLYIEYQSEVDWRIARDILHCNPQFHAHDDPLVMGRLEYCFAAVFWATGEGGGEAPSRAVSEAVSSHSKVARVPQRLGTAGDISQAALNSGSFGLLPPCPQIFHGCESELQDVVNILIQDSAHIAILGAGGMGKTSLATAALHNPQVEAKYSHQYFVPCHSSPTCTELAATIADHIGLEKGSNLQKRIAHYFAHAPPSLLILDNLETPWEALSARSEVEEFLSLLTDAPHLGLMITLRGAEHPSKVKWTRPFLAPLKPLSNVAAQQTFIEVADDGHDDASIKELLELTGNLLLAVSLIVNVASAEGCAKALSRWKLESTRMLSDGYDQRLSLDISIMLSYTSSRMTPGAQELLSILSMLPDGLADANLVQAKLPILDILACKATLIKTALAFVDQDQHLKVLVPIREHILHTHPPANALKLKLQEHFHHILDLWNQFRNLNVADILPQISGNLGNFNTVLHDGLEPEGPDIVQNLRSILFLNDFYIWVHSTYSPLLLKLSGQMLHWKDNQIFGEYLIKLLEASNYLPDLDFNSDITLGTQHFTSKDALEQNGTVLWECISGRQSQILQEPCGIFKQHILWQKVLDTLPVLATLLWPAYVAFFIDTRKSLSALTHAKEAYRYAEHIGDIYGQAWSLSVQVGCHLILANYWHAQHLLQKSRHILATLGHQQSGLNLSILNLQAEIHLVKSEYLESHKLHVAIASSSQATSHKAILANLNNAFIDIATGADSKIIHQNLDITQSHLRELYGYHGRRLCIFNDYIAAELCLKDGALGTVNAMFEKCDDETALSLFMVALDGFTFMDVHRWRADCMVRIADILQARGMVIKSIELWKTARPLFERSSQMKDVIKIDAKIAEVDSAILAKYEEQLQHLSELYVPVSALEEAYITEEEEEENKLAQGSDIWDKGRHGVLV